MASVSKDASGHVRVLFMGLDKKRKSVRLGRVSKKVADAVRVKVETLLASLASRTPLDSETAAWVGGMG